MCVCVMPLLIRPYEIRSYDWPEQRGTHQANSDVRNPALLPLAKRLIHSPWSGRDHSPSINCNFLILCKLLRGKPPTLLSVSKCHMFRTDKGYLNSALYQRVSATSGIRSRYMALNGLFLQTFMIESRMS